MGKCIDMTGWIMSEHGVPDSKLTVIKRVENNQCGDAMWLCECNCKTHTLITVKGSSIRSGHTLSCGCVSIEKTVRRNKARKTHNENGFCEDGVSKWILFNNVNEKTYYDVNDAANIEQYTWYKSKKGYATTSIDGKEIAMHQLIGLKGHDHIDRDTLNNRRSNLRKCTQQENCMNRTIYRNNKSGIIGVNWDKARQKWRVSIGINLKTKHIGYFENLNNAIKERLLAEQKYFGEFAPQRHLFEQYKINEEV